MKKYGLRRIADGYIYYADSGFAKTCRDEDEKFGTDDLNEAFRFKEVYYVKSDPVEIFEK